MKLLVLSAFYIFFFHLLLPWQTTTDCIIFIKYVFESRTGGWDIQEHESSICRCSFCDIRQKNKTDSHSLNLLIRAVTPLPNYFLETHLWILLFWQVNFNMNFGEKIQTIPILIAGPFQKNLWSWLCVVMGSYKETPIPSQVSTAQNDAYHRLFWSPGWLSGLLYHKLLRRNTLWLLILSFCNFSSN